MFTQMNQTTFIRVVQVQGKVKFYPNTCKYWVLLPPHCHYPLIATSYPQPYTLPLRKRMNPLDSSTILYKIKWNA
jgi:hypothetical protein